MTLREIVNGATLTGYLNKKVSIIGYVTDKSSNGLSFDIRTTDNQIVKVTLKRPLDQPIDGYVEVHGTSMGKSLAADHFVVFSNTTFDAKAYNKLCTFLTSIQNLWNVS